MSPEEAQNQIESILDQAAARIAEICQERFNATCACPADHEIAISDWVFVYEHVDMRPGGDPLTALEIAHSSNSWAAATGQLDTAAAIVRTKSVHYNLSHE